MCPGPTNTFRIPDTCALGLPTHSEYLTHVSWAYQHIQNTWHMCPGPTNNTNLVLFNIQRTWRRLIYDWSVSRYRYLFNTHVTIFSIKEVVGSDSDSDEELLKKRKKTKEEEVGWQKLLRVLRYMLYQVWKCHMSVPFVSLSCIYEVLCKHTLSKLNRGFDRWKIVPKLRSSSKTVPRFSKKNTGCSDLHVIESPDSVLSVGSNTCLENTSCEYALWLSL
jgi:hypothetical protein